MGFYGIPFQCLCGASPCVLIVGTFSNQVIHNHCACNGCKRGHRYRHRHLTGKCDIMEYIAKYWFFSGLVANVSRTVAFGFGDIDAELVEVGGSLYFERIV